MCWLRILLKQLWFDDQDMGTLPHLKITDIENPVLEYSIDENGNKINGAASFEITSTNTC